jgi:gluconate 2-dehydrogenase gamma chain
MWRSLGSTGEGLDAETQRRRGKRRERMIPRRAFLAAGSVAAVGCGRRGEFRVLSEAEARRLETLLACLIPSDDTPGAREAGVVHYIDRQLSRQFKAHRKTYRDGLAAADRLAGGGLAAEEVVRELERASKPFFDLLVAHAMQGFYGDPRHGGNRDFASWRMLGISPVQVRGRDAKS